MTKQKLATALTQRFFLNVRDVIGNLIKMLKPLGGQELLHFPFLMRQWWPPQHKGGGNKKCISLPERLALIVIQRPKGISHCYLSIGRPKRGDKRL